MSKKTYEALPGVEWVNGQPVPESREMELSAAEAMFDLAQGRIQLKDEADQAKAVTTVGSTEPALDVLPEAETDEDGTYVGGEKQFTPAIEARKGRR